MTEVEIEKKFLLQPCAPKRFLKSHEIDYHKYVIQQYYLAPVNGQYVRYRRKDSLFFKTIKSGEGMVREEHESQVSGEEFLEHLDGHIGRLIEKERFVFEYGSMTYELDRFKKSLKGLCYLEIEFSDEAQAHEFILPKIFERLVIAEVTEDKRFNNASLSHLETIPSLDTDLDRLLRSVERAVTLKPKGDAPAIEPFESTSCALRTVIHGFIHQLKENREALCRGDEDPEILHQFRIAMRRLRALLGEFDNYFETSWLDGHQEILSRLMKETGAKRDVDVTLETMSVYRALLPRKMKKGLDPVKAFLIYRRDNLREKVAVLADSDRLQDEISAFEKIQRDDNVFRSEASQPIVLSAMRVLNKRLKRITKEGRKIGPDTDDKAYHKLRIQFKKLRYLIEAMEPLIDRSKYQKVIKMIKKMQTILGNYHDCQIQRFDLALLAKETELQQKETQKALKRVQKVIKGMEEKERKAYRKGFKSFMEHEEILEYLFEVC
ncbi:MAG: CHAD domain-containing protein [Campylobacterota bacterium]|nr:CHAD domain-containing protein [Campylobacterota bacterium]